MFGGISIIGWFHTILGTAAIVVGLYLLIRDKFIYIDNKLAYFYLISTLLTCASSFLLYGATGSFNTAHWLSVITILAVLFAWGIREIQYLRFFKYLLKAISLNWNSIL